MPRASLLALHAGTRQASLPTLAYTDAAELSDAVVTRLRQDGVQSAGVFAAILDSRAAPAASIESGAGCASPAEPACRIGLRGDVATLQQDTRRTAAAWLLADLDEHAAQPQTLTRTLRSLRATSAARVRIVQRGATPPAAAQELPGLDGREGWACKAARAAPGNTLAPAYALVLRTLKLVQDDADPRAIEHSMRADPALSFKLLRYINSAGLTRSREIGSLGEAILLLGQRPLLRWLALVLVTAGIDHGPTAVLALTSITRARLLEGLAREAAPAAADTLFMLGLFSLLDHLLATPMASAIGPLQLPDDQARALIEGTGPLADWLQLAAATEGDPIEALPALMQRLHVSAAQVNQCHLDALQWAGELLR